MKTDCNSKKGGSFSQQSKDFVKKKKKKKGMNLKTKLSWPSFKSLVENCWVADKTGSLVPRTLDFSIEKTWEVATWGCQVFRFLSTLTKILPLLKSFHYICDGSFESLRKVHSTCLHWPPVPFSPSRWLFFFWPYRMACGVLLPWPATEPMPSAVKSWSTNHWTTREFP